ncbi:MAG: hypothetical protein ABFC63_01850 [Thermoguttaceae bacterium]
MRLGRLLHQAACLAALLFLLGPAGVSMADDTLLTDVLTGKKMRFSNDRWLWVNVVNGRMSLKCTQLIQFTTSADGFGTRETFKVQNDNGRPRLHYERSGGQTVLKIELAAAGDDLHISRSVPAKSKQLPLDFRQSATTPAVLTMGADAQKQVFRAGDLWELLIELPSECREQLLPLLDMLRPTNKLSDMVADVETKLWETAGRQAEAEENRWSTLVRQLGDDHFATREAADRQLREGGAAALAYLRHLDFGALDAEQRFRIRRILNAASAQVEDDLPQQVAASLAGTPSVWLALLERPQVETRKIAARQLTTLLGRPIDVDPTASPDSQKKQREKLRQWIKKK